jgi:predicted peptidase
MNVSLFRGLVGACCLGASALAYTPSEKISREWTAADGRKLQADLMEYDGTEVRLKRASDLQVMKVSLTALSAEDKKFILAMVQERKLDTALTDGSYKDKITGKFVQGTSKQGLNYQLYGNHEWEGAKRFPIVIWLHGSGQSGSDNTSQMGGATGVFTKPENQEKNPCFVLAPQCPDADIGWNKDVATNLMALIGDIVMNLPVDQKRIYLTGSSMGGFGTFSLVMKHPGIFAAGVPLCGGSDAKNAEALMTTPLWAFHGDKDDMVPVERTRNVMNAITAAGGKKARYTELTGEGHGITGSVYPRTDLHEWLFAQRLGSE